MEDVGKHGFDKEVLAWLQNNKLTILDMCRDGQQRLVRRKRMNGRGTNLSTVLKKKFDCILLSMTSCPHKGSTGIAF
jgi:hypothetical protein